MEAMSANGAAPGGHPWTDPSSQWMSAELVPLENDPSLILILSDINMPGRGGLEMLPKGAGRTAERAGDHDSRLWRRGHQAARNSQGAVGLLTKPIDFALLRQEIDARLDQAA